MEAEVTLFAVVEYSLGECWSEAELKLETLHYRFGTHASQINYGSPPPRQIELVFKLHNAADQPHRRKANIPHLGIHVLWHDFYFN